MKEYIKPALEYRNLCVEEEITLIDPDFGTSDMPDDWE